MKLAIQEIHHETSPEIAGLIRKEVELLEKEIVVEEARLTIERHLEASPAFRVSAQIVTPGPDLFADACDHTIQAALRKAIKQLELGIRHRIGKRAQRVRSNIQEPAARRDGVMVAAKATR